jgi:3-phosphoshikimate 1-carboxyvinyltransferase
VTPIATTVDGFSVRGVRQLHGGAVESHGDHRLGNSLAVAGLVANGDVVLDDCEIIADTSYPLLWTHMEQVVR